MRRYFAGFDGGGTRTVCVLADSEGKVLGTGSSGPSNHITVGLERARASIKASFDEAAAKAKVRRPVSGACLGMAGLDSPSALRTMVRAVRSMRLAERNIVVNDWRTALAGAFVVEPGVVLIAGTGCVAAGADAKGRVVRVGGWGNVVDDRGSAYDIGREALYAAMRAHDGRGPHTTLLPSLMKRFRVGEPEGIIQRVYSEGTSAAELASLASLVSAAAAEGDEIAVKILREKAALLAELVITVASELGLLEGRFGVALNGGVFNAGPPLLEPMWRSIRASAPLARHRRATLPPACGAILLLEDDPALRRRLAARLSASLRGKVRK